jgi:hypothetical protein
MTLMTLSEVSTCSQILLCVLLIPIPDPQQLWLLDR